MDKTETYIAMMKGALPFLVEYMPRDSEGCLNGRQPIGLDSVTGNFVPLFQQHQLQEMIPSHPRVFFVICSSSWKLSKVSGMNTASNLIHGSNSYWRL